MERKQLPQLADELRQFLIESVSKTGGHLSSNLGTVELTIALHYVFNTPHDKLVWDVGHQTYTHKILTGRREAMNRLRMPGGISGFPKRGESPYDAFGTGHSSTSISAALGMAVAAKLAGSDSRSVAIIGDGAMTGGMAFEALNNAGAMNANLLVVLNDNDMSISSPVGALNNYLAKLMSGGFYTAMRRGSEKVLKGMPPVLEFAKRAEEHVKGMVMPGTLFEEFGFNYIGPIDGHDLDVLVDHAEQYPPPRRPAVPACGHAEGQGLCPCGRRLRAVSRRGQIRSGQRHHRQKRRASRPIRRCSATGCATWRQQDERLVGITPAMCEGSGMVEFAQKFPERYFDVGIAEQHALTFAAGLACDGMQAGGGDLLHLSAARL